MFREIKDVRQEPGAGRRRWFEADGLEFVVWLANGSADRITGFQFCYDDGSRQVALTWRAGAGFSQGAVDSGERTPLRNETPIILPAGEVSWRGIARKFEQHGRSLDPWLRDFVQEKLAAAGRERQGDT